MDIVKPSGRNSDSYIALSNAIYQLPQLKPAHADAPSTARLVRTSDQAVSSILLACYTRALFTRAHAQLNASAMYSSIDKCRLVVQADIRNIRSKQSQLIALDLLSALDSLLATKDKPNASDWSCQVDKWKLMALVQFSKLSAQTHEQYPLPHVGHLAEATYLTEEEARKAPSLADITIGDAQNLGSNCASSAVGMDRRSATDIYPIWAPTGDDVIDSTQARLNILKSATVISDADLINALRPMFNAPVYDYLGEELPEDALYTFCRTTQILQVYSGAFTSPSIRHATLLSTEKLILLQELFSDLYGPAFSAQQHCNIYKNSRDQFVAHMPNKVKDPSELSPKAGDARKALVTALVGVGLK